MRFLSIRQALARAALRALALAAALGAGALLAGCGGMPMTQAEATATARDVPAGVVALSPFRTVAGGFLAAPGAAFGMPTRPGGGAYVKLLAPAAVALRGNDLLVADSGSGRVWRVDLALNTFSPIAGVTASLGSAVALGPDLSAWVLDGVSRQVQRFSRDARLLQSYRTDNAATSTAAFTLADGGATLLLADDSQRQWLELRPAGGLATPVRPSRVDDSARARLDAPAADADADAPRGVRGVDGLASAGDTVYVLDRNAAVVHVVRRDGQVTGQLGAGELKQPVAIAADRRGRVFVVDAQDRAIKLLRPGRPAQVFDAAQLRVQMIGGIAVDEQFLAVTDRLSGQVVIHSLREGPAP